jgi:2-polyprenyl-3-methyl-5-hydroxy-6-metoxy-1,4-benzoquinol methylase
MAPERVSLLDDSLIRSYAENIQRYEFALRYCKGKRVLDAGCGSGYGAQFLAENGARTVLALDVSEEAIEEAKRTYRSVNLRFERRDIETLQDDPTLRDQFDVVVNFENVAHLARPERMIEGVSLLLSTDGTFLISSPNGEISPLDARGKPAYKFHHRVYTASGLRLFVSPYFAQVFMYGQWLSHAGMLRQAHAKELFAQLCEAYYNPMSRIGRAIKRLAGRRMVGPPRFTGATDSFAGDYVIRELESNVFPWAATVLIAVCNKLHDNRTITQSN